VLICIQAHVCEMEMKTSFFLVGGVLLLVFVLRYGGWLVVMGVDVKYGEMIPI